MDLWDIPFKPSPSSLFTMELFFQALSDKIVLNDCVACQGSGKEKCYSCFLTGMINCDNCDGRGICMTNSGKTTICGVCQGIGQVPCRDCHGSGSVTCGACHGNRRSFGYQSVMIINFIHCSWLLTSHVMVLVKSLVIVLFLKKNSIKHQE